MVPRPGADLAGWAAALVGLVTHALAPRVVQLAVAGDGSLSIAGSGGAANATARLPATPSPATVARVERRVSLLGVAVRALPLLAAAAAATVVFVGGAWAHSLARLAVAVALLAAGLVADVFVQRHYGAARERVLLWLRLGSELVGVQVDPVRVHPLLAAMGRSATDGDQPRLSPGR